MGPGPVNTNHSQFNLWYTGSQSTPELPDDLEDRVDTPIPENPELINDEMDPPLDGIDSPPHPFQRGYGIMDAVAFEQYLLDHLETQPSISTSISDDHFPPSTSSHPSLQNTDRNATSTPSEDI